jgi:transposase
MQEDQLLMTQSERDRLATLKEAKKKLITQREAAERLGVSVRHVKRMIHALKKRGDKAVIHALRGKPSKRRIDQSVERESVKILSADVYKGFGPTLAAEYLKGKHNIKASKETVRQWMIRGKLWKGKRAKISQIHTWRPRRSRCGDLVQWDTSTHDWLEGRGERIYLIAMIDDATSRLFARFVRSDSTEENMKLLWSYVETHGRPAAVYTDKASLFQNTEKRKRDEPGVGKDPKEMPPTQIGRALQELGIVWIGAHSPQAKGRVERNFQTAQDRLVKGMRVAGVTTIEQANRYLNEEYLAWWEREMTVEPANPQDGHRPLESGHDLAASLSHVESREVKNDHTIRVDAVYYRIKPESIVAGLRGADVRIEKRLDGTLAARFRDRYLKITACEKPPPAPPSPKRAPAPPRAKRKSDWNKNFDLQDAPPIWKAAQGSGYQRKGNQ